MWVGGAYRMVGFHWASRWESSCVRENGGCNRRCDWYARVCGVEHQHAMPNQISSSGMPHPLPYLASPTTSSAPPGRCRWPLRRRPPRTKTLAWPWKASTYQLRIDVLQDPPSSTTYLYLHLLVRSMYHNLVHVIGFKRCVTQLLKCTVAHTNYIQYEV